MKKHFVLNWGTYQNDTIVFVGKYKKEEVVKVIKSVKWGTFAKFLERDEDFNQVLTGDYPGFACVKSGFSALFLREWKNDWTHINTLLHELHHLVFLIMGGYRRIEEVEAQAYQFCYLFDKLRIKLNNMGCGSKKKGSKKK